jgi:hypothetical protein
MVSMPIGHSLRSLQVLLQCRWTDQAAHRFLSDLDLQSRRPEISCGTSPSTQSLTPYFVRSHNLEQPLQFFRTDVDSTVSLQWRCANEEEMLEFDPLDEVFRN